MARSRFASLLRLVLLAGVPAASGVLTPRSLLIVSLGT
jgi:hypothetical protein